jgi:hypothetical protein
MHDLLFIGLLGALLFGPYALAWIIILLLFTRKGKTPYIEATGTGSRLRRRI